MRGAKILFAALAIASCVRAAEAGDGSKIYLRLDVCGSMHSSDQNLETAYYAAGPDYSIFTDLETKMLYHFDQKFGASIAGAAGYRLTNTLACECAVGYTSYFINEINQNSRRTRLEDGDRVSETIDYPDAECADFTSIVVRPALRLRPASQGKIALYISAGANVAILSGSGDLVFEMPRSSIDGLPPEVASLEFDGSGVLFGVDVESGIEFALSPSMALHVGASYLAMQKAFKSFHEILLDAALADELESVGYSFEGMNFSGLRAVAGVIWYP